MWTFQNATNEIAQSEIADHINSSNTILTQMFDRYSLLGQQLVTTNPNLIQLVDNPKADIDLNNVLIATKASYAIDEIFLLTHDTKILFQNTADTSIISSEEFKKVAVGIFETKVRRGFFLDSPQNGQSVFYMIFPVQGKKEVGILVLGKVFDQQFLTTLFPYSQNGLMIFSRFKNTEVVSSNIDPKIFAQVVKDLNPQKDIDYSVESKVFTGNIRITDLRYNTFIVGTVGYFIDTSQFIKVRNTLIATTSIGIFLTIFIQLITLVLLRRLIVSPIAQLENGFEKIMAGDFSVRMKDKGLVEIQKINVSFNKTVVKLLDTNQNLEAKITERTVELNNKLTEIAKINELMIGRELKMIELKKDLEQLSKNQKP